MSATRQDMSATRQGITRGIAALVLAMLSCSVTAGALQATAVVASAKELRVRFAPEKDYGPFVYQDKSGEIRGLSIDIFQTIATASSLQVDYLPAGNLSDILTAAREGRVDLISSVRPTPERAAYLDFSRPYVSVPAVLVMPSGEPARHSLADLAGKVVAVGKGYAVEAYVRERYPAIQWLAVPDDATALHLLLSGKAHAAVADIASVGFVIREERLQGLQVHAPVGFQYELSFAYPKNRPDIGQALELGLRNVNPLARDNAARRWIDSDALDYQSSRTGATRWIAGGALALAAVLAGVALWRRRR